MRKKTKTKKTKRGHGLKIKMVFSFCSFLFLVLLDNFLLTLFSLFQDLFFLWKTSALSLVLSHSVCLSEYLVFNLSLSYAFNLFPPFSVLFIVLFLALLYFDFHSKYIIFPPQSPLPLFSLSQKKNS